jgi:SAM-dependent methyltransferase
MPDDGRETWLRFLAWLPTAEPRGDVELMLRQHREWLAAHGATEDEAHGAMRDIMRRLNEGGEGWRLLFDKIYASPQPVFRTSANALLAQVATSRRPGRALDVCMGEGRNTVFLAQQGWRTTGIDVSSEGLDQARRRAADASVELTLIQERADAFDYASQRWDLISVCYAPVPITDPAYVARLTQTLEPGGVVVVESFASDREERVRKPVDIDPRDLRDAFAGFAIEELQDVIDVPDWAQQAERVVRMVAEKLVTSGDQPG